VVAVPRQRRHTLHFLAATRSTAPVYLDAAVDASALIADRAAGERVSVLAYVVQAVGRVLARHPDANAAWAGGPLRARRVLHPFVDVKLTLDKEVAGTRVVLSAVLADADVASRAFLAARIARLRDADPARLPEFAGVRALHRLPLPAGRAAYHLADRPAARHRHRGTVSVTSLAHRHIGRFHSDGGTAITVGVGRIAPHPVVRDGLVAVAPILPLSLTFDHRLVDGALAADVLDDLVATLTQPPGPGCADVAR
jgi:pyruvate/2-oxoglutarate dehydrogenase complex dihydrolipoamide acyltransferase (E2) component